jgi:hypothetical protein
MPGGPTARRHPGEARHLNIGFGNFKIILIKLTQIRADNRFRRGFVDMGGVTEALLRRA